MKQRALDAEREARVRQGELVELAPFRDAMVETWRRMLLLARNRFLGFPSKLASQFPRFKDQAEIFDWSTSEIRKILDLLAHSKPIAFDGPYRVPRYEIKEDADDVDEEAPAYDERKRAVGGS